MERWSTKKRNQIEKNEIMDIDLQALWDQYEPWIVSGVLKVIGALIVLIIGLRIAKWLGRLVREASVRQPRIDDTLGSFFGSIIQWTVTAATIIATLQVFGVQASTSHQLCRCARRDDACYWSLASGRAR